MSFELVRPGMSPSFLPDGQIGIQVRGMATVRVSDLAKASITGDRVAVLADASTRRIALRGPTDSDGDATFPLRPHGKHAANGKSRKAQGSSTATRHVGPAASTSDGRVEGRGGGWAPPSELKDHVLLIVNLGTTGPDKFAPVRG